MVQIQGVDCDYTMLLDMISDVDDSIFLGGIFYLYMQIENIRAKMLKQQLVKDSV